MPGRFPTEQARTVPTTETSATALKTTPVLIAGGGPIGMTLARGLAHYGVPSMLVERNPTTTRHPKMDITNGRSLELFRSIGLAQALRDVAVPEDNPFDVSWITSLVGDELHRFRYPSVTAARAQFRERNDGSQPLEPGMRVSQVEIEPALKAAIDAHPLVDVRFGVGFEELEQDASGVTATLKRTADGTVERVRCQYLVGCDGGTSRVRTCLDIPLEGQSRLQSRFMTHFRSPRTDLLQRWGIAWHYQSPTGTLIAQNDRDVWTLQSRLAPDVDPETVDPHALIEAFAGSRIDEVEILVANSWVPHLLVADAYGKGRVLLAGDAVHQYIPTGGYGMNTGIGDAFDLAWKLAATIQGFGGPKLLASYEEERRPVGLRNREGSRTHSATRAEIAKLYTPALATPGADGDASRRAAGARIAAIGNLENECFGIEFGYCYAGSSIVCGEPNAAVPTDPVRYEPTTLPGARLPSTYLGDGTPLFDRLGRWFTLIGFGTADMTTLAAAAERRGVPLSCLRLDGRDHAPVYEGNLLLVRPDQHVAWRGNSIDDPEHADRIMARIVGAAD
jgi:2-polyprenyl-6-methoxyphenol hydroxylase-like FAD-dependent oxidoreductase